MHILSVSEKIFAFICGIGILQGVLLAKLIYFHPKSDRSVNIFLALYIFCTSAVMTLPFIMDMIGWQNSFFIQPIPLLTGPLIYLYLRSFKEKIKWNKAILHFLPFFLFFFLSYWNLQKWGSKFPDAKYVQTEAMSDPFSLFLIYSRPAQLLLYYFLSRKTLISYQKSIKHLYSETSRIDLRWAKFLVNGYLILILTFVAISPLFIKFPEQFNLLMGITMAVATPYIYIATYKGILQPTIWQLQPNKNKETITQEIHNAEEFEAESTTKKTKAAINEEKVDDLARRIMLLMEEEKIYQETELTLQQLAGKLEVPTYQVSLALKEGLKRNFYDLINGYRVEEAKRLLLDSKNSNYTILSVGFEAGFNSKTTFNTVFKKFTGLTPTDFREKQRERQEGTLALA